MEKDTNDLSDCAESLGVLNLDNLKVFGESSSNSSVSSKRVNDRLNKERLKAMETLQKGNKNVHPKLTNKEYLKIPCATPHSTNNSPRLNHTEYVPYRRPPSINISDLITDKSITLDLKSSISTANNIKVSFEPSEITARSTHYTERKLNKMSKDSIAVANRLSVSDILASSFAPKARDLSDILAERISSATSTTLGSMNYSHNMLRTADMSRISSEGRFDGVGSGVFSFEAVNVTGMDSEEFQPAENMRTKLLMDENSWAQEFATIPTAAMDKGGLLKEIDPKDFDALSNPNSSLLARNPNLSMGCFFNQRSEDLHNIVRSMSPERMRAPIALVDETQTAVSSSTAKTAHTTTDRKKVTESINHAELSPQMDNKTYNKANVVTRSSILYYRKPKPDSKQESKDSGNGTKEEEESYLISLSHIKKAFTNNIDMGIPSSELIDLLRKEKRNKSLQNREQKEIDERYKTGSQSQSTHSPKETAVSISTTKSPLNTAKNAIIAENYTKSVSALVNMLSENKENLDPQKMRGVESQADTISFTESLFDTSDLKELQQSIGQPRSPLSPLNLPIVKLTSDEVERDDDWRVNDQGTSAKASASRCILLPRSPLSPLNIPIVKLTSDEVERDDDWQVNDQGTPVKASASRSKLNSPIMESTTYNAPSSLRQATATLNTNVVTSMQSNQSPSSLSPLQQKPLSSTRLDGQKSDCDFVAISPNISKSVVCSKNNGTERPLLMTDSHYNGVLNDASSPIRTYASSKPISPVVTPSGNLRRGCDKCSPHMRGKTQRNIGLNSQPTTSSPSGSESSVYGGAPMRVVSATSLRNGNTNGVVVRSISRCSSNSEFSHRDGKPIPLKVTALELSWCSTRLRNSAHKSMQVKNNGNKKLTLRIDVNGPGYQMVNMPINNTLTLQSQECRSIVVSFCPTVIGAAVGKLSFYAPQNATVAHNSASTASMSPLLEIPLYGYGGHCSIVSQEVHMGPLGMPFLQMGYLHELSQPLQRTIRVYNKGPLLGFAIASIDSVGLRLPCLCTAFEVQPTAMLIPPGSTVTLRVVFRPQRDDVRKITRQTKPVLTLANLRLISGDEANRQRMRQLVGRMSSEERTKLRSSKSLEALWDTLPGEKLIADLETFKEPPSLTFDLLTHMRVHEVALTINDDALDETIKSTSSFYFPDEDETVLFRTVCSRSPSVADGGGNALDRVDEIVEEEDHAGSNNSSSHGEACCWSVLPSTLTFYLGAERRVVCSSIFICNSFKSRQYFEVSSNRKNLLQLMPSEGYVEPDGGHLEVEVELLWKKMTADDRQKPIHITVSMENERITVPVKLCDEARPPERMVRRQ